MSSKKEVKVVSFDTSFFIRLLNTNDALNTNAVDYLQYFVEQGYELHISTIAIAEFCVKGEYDTLPLDIMLVSPFNIDGAKLAGQCARALVDEQSEPHHNCQ